MWELHDQQSQTVVLKLYLFCLVYNSEAIMPGLNTEGPDRFNEWLVNQAWNFFTDIKTSDLPRQSLNRGCWVILYIESEYTRRERERGTYLCSQIFERLTCSTSCPWGYACRNLPLQNCSSVLPITSFKVFSISDLMSPGPYHLHILKESLLQYGKYCYLYKCKKKNWW